MSGRKPGDPVKVEDLLREEYFDLLPEIRRVVWQVEAEIRCQTLPILQALKPYEQLTVKSRVKDCESAVKALRRRQEGGTFDAGKSKIYSLLDLPDLAGVRVLAFPRSRVIEADNALQSIFQDWISDPIPDGQDGVLAPKYSGRRLDVSSRVRAEYQVVPMLIGLFWEVEHSAIYKPAPALKGRAESDPMKELNKEVVAALSRFEAEYEAFVRD